MVFNLKKQSEQLIAVSCYKMIIGGLTKLTHQYNTTESVNLECH